MKMDDQVDVASEGASFIPRVCTSLLGLLALLLMPVSTFAQDAPGPALGNVQGQTELQRATGIAVQTVCGQFIANGRNGALEDALFARCGEMVHTARVLNGEQGEGATGLALGIEADQLNAALQNVATEETATPGTMATETSSGQTSNVGARLGALRGGATGFSVGGLSFDIDGVALNSQSLGLGDGLGQSGDSELTGKRLGGFINGGFGTGEKDTTPREDGFDFDTTNITLGVDYRVTDAIVLGGALGYNDQSTDFKTSTTVEGGSVDGDGFSLTGYGLYYLEKTYLTGLLGYGSNSFDISRKVFIAGGGTTTVRTATANTDSDQITISFGAGRDKTKGKWTYGPSLRIDYLDVDIDGYRETGAQELDVIVETQTVQSLTTNLGGNVSYSSSKGFGVLVPYGRAEWVHEFDNDSRNIVARYANDPRANRLTAITDEPDENYFTVGAGVSAVFRNGIQTFIDYETILGLEDLTEHLVKLGVRREF